MPTQPESLPSLSETQRRAFAGEIIGRLLDITRGSDVEWLASDGCGWYGAEPIETISTWGTQRQVCDFAAHQLKVEKFMIGNGQMFMASATASMDILRTDVNTTFLEKNLERDFMEQLEKLQVADIRDYANVFNALYDLEAQAPSLRLVEPG